MFRSAGMAYNEVVVALLDEPRSTDSLRRYAYLLAGGITLLLLPWLPPCPGCGLNRYPVSVLIWPAWQLLLPWIALLMPGLNVFQSWYQGAILHGAHGRSLRQS